MMKFFFSKIPFGFFPGNGQVLDPANTVNVPVVAVSNKKGSISQKSNRKSLKDIVMDGYKNRRAGCLIKTSGSPSIA